MSATGLKGFDRTLQETNIWLNDISDAMEDPRREMAYHALRGVLFALRDRLPVDETFDLSAQLPLLVRGVFFEGYRPAGKPEKYGREEFFDRVRRELQAVGGANVERAVRGVFGMLEKHVADGEIAEIRASLPNDLRNLWPEPAGTPQSGRKSE